MYVLLRKPKTNSPGSPGKESWAKGIDESPSLAIPPFLESSKTEFLYSANIFSSRVTLLFLFGPGKGMKELWLP
jgi:hypothetical protein